MLPQKRGVSGQSLANFVREIIALGQMMGYGLENGNGFLQSG